ncbi:MAG: hypothetical protein WDO56_32710 [Gammaproteobacteria bacterium]
MDASAQDLIARGGVDGKAEIAKEMDLEKCDEPTGLAKVCVPKTGSHINSCVGVDGNGDGNVKDDDLSKDQKETLANDFRTFIQNNNGKDLGSWGADVFGAPGDKETLSVPYLSSSGRRQEARRGMRLVSSSAPVRRSEI